MHIPSGNTDEARLLRLNKILDAIVHGKQALSRHNAPLFLEAICAQPQPAACAHKIATGKAGLASLQNAMFMDPSLTFLNTTATGILMYIQSPELKDIKDGQLLRELVLKIVDPSIFWMAFTEAFRSGKLQENGQLCFAWLLLQLVSLPGEAAAAYRDEARELGLLDTVLASSNGDIRTHGHKIKHILDTCGPGDVVQGDYAPGGRHDNDKVDFRDIAIMPTADEITCQEMPFLRLAGALEDVEVEHRLATHLDNQFRLLREDMLHEMREELQIASGKTKKVRRGLVVDGLKLFDVHDHDQSKRPSKLGLLFRSSHDLWFFKKIKNDKRQALLKANPKYVRHQSLACLLVDDEVVAFPTIHRNEELLARNPPVFTLQFEGKESTVKALLKLRRATNVKLVQIDTAIFAYEPILKALQKTQSMPLTEELLNWTKDSSLIPPRLAPQTIIEALQTDPKRDLSKLLGTSRPIVLDDAQAASLLSCLTQRVSLIQGPPGTGKSFIGALLAKVLHDFTQQTVLVCCYTNHALDQFLEDLLDIGIPQRNIVRLGGKTTPRTDALSLYNRKQTSKFGRADWNDVNSLKADAFSLFSRLKSAFDKCIKSNVSMKDVMAHIEFEDAAFYDAFHVPQSTEPNGMQQVGRGGKLVDPLYLLQQWDKGKDAGIFKKEPHILAAAEIWGMEVPARRAQYIKWQTEILREGVETFQQIAEAYNKSQHKIGRKFSEGDATVLRSTRIVGCTTTAAAKYAEDLRAASPDVLLVEEAGEILESHILTALGANTKQLVLIGDHKQLRPKVNHYLLTVEKGEGYDLNMSLFERLVLQGYPHETLAKQHRMRPEIAALIRNLTYPDLVDADGTKNRANIRGLQDNIVFITHDKPEDEISKVADLKDMGSKSSKQNTHEVHMILKTLRYLAQQGYGTDRMVILTPYLGQMYNLREELKADNDPVLNDLDSFDLVRAGLLTAATAKLTKKPIRLATVDNYQGEESDIVLVSLTRSNPNHDIGFMSSPERLNVLLSRARDGLIMIGNADTFGHARKGNELWGRLFELLARGRHIYDGLPVKCERHPDRTNVLKNPTQFDEQCPDGGCSEPCGTKLNCGIHDCPSKCHQLFDHSKMKCEHIVKSTCSKGHPQSWKCFEGATPACAKCEREAKLADDKLQKDFELARKRDAEQQEHAKQLAQLDEQIAAERQSLQDRDLAQQRADAIRQKEQDLAAAKERAVKRSKPAPPTREHAQPPMQTGTTTQPDLNASESTPPEEAQDDIQVSVEGPTNVAIVSPAQQEWQRQKDMDGANNEHIDALMEMTGLEEVKDQVLSIKDKIEVTKRQGTSVKDERFNVTLLGNPGTGKTTVARHYAKFLSSVDVLPGDAFVETTGSRLANDGVSAVKKHIEDIMKAGGGAIFVDEAYQLKSDNNISGGQVLDFLLAEMENNVGKIVFILAGYNKQMEKFFEHNPGLTSRVPYRLQFSDYKDQELLTMLEKLIERKYSGKMKVEDGIRGLYGRIAVRRLGRGRGRDGFGNARALQNIFIKISERQAKRLTKERKEGRLPDDFLMLKQDLIGPDPSKAVLESGAWKELSDLIGLSMVKESVRNLFDLINRNYQRELREKEPVQVSLNRVFVGSPGTGKTTVAKLYGQILADLGLLSNGEVVVKNPADFVGDVLGASESNTKAILASTIGKVLVIDEAYMLYSGRSGSGKQGDPYKTAVIDTIVAEIQSVPGEDRCVLMLGYEDQMREMFQNVNPGLSRRFAIEDAFHFENFTDPELLKILELKLKKQDLAATDAAKRVAIEVLSRARNRPNFGNGGEVENLLSRAKGHYQTRQKSVPSDQRSLDVIFEPQDFDPDFNRTEHSTNNLKKLFEDVVGCEDVVGKLEEYQSIARVLKAQGKGIQDARNLVPMKFVFKGPPGTGKTTTARKMGQVYYDMGFLSSTEVVECSASDLVGEYVGHTGPKTKKLFEKALGKVLFIDEAYRLSEGHFAKEAIDELVGILTDEKFKGKLVVILAGYDQDMNKLMSVNPGLLSRFPDEILFENMPPEACLEVLRKELQKNDVSCPVLEDPFSEEYKILIANIAALSILPSWGNARDIITLAQKMIREVYKVYARAPAIGSTMVLSGKTALACSAAMLMERHERFTNLPDVEAPESSPPIQALGPQPPAPPAFRTGHATKAAQSKQAPSEEVAIPEADAPAQSCDERDAGVPDHIWRQLQADKRAKSEEDRRKQEKMQALERALQEAQKQEEIERKAQEEVQRALQKLLEHKRAQDAAAAAELKRKLEQQRLKELAARAERERRAAALEAQRQREAEERKREAMVQAKLRQMGVCVAGFRWIKQADGYRCAGGSHFASNAALGI